MSASLRTIALLASPCVLASIRSMRRWIVAGVPFADRNSTLPLLM
jgi:hypothetical protein